MTDKGKMTPGPWYARACPDRRLKEWWIDASPNKANGETRGKPLAEVRHYHNGETEANARAIACLPELVEVARGIESTRPSSTEHAEAMINLRRILARIEGEEA